jgi:TonB family protein
MQRKNFWYALVWPLHEYRVNASDKGGTVPMQALNRVFAVGLLLIGGWIATSAPSAWGQEIDRKPKSKVAPVYPELAKRMNISGVVKILITVAANGTIKDVKLVGGHPLLASAAMDAVKKWRFEAGPQEATGIVEFRFDPTQ